VSPDKPAPEIIHIVYGGGIVLAAYRGSAVDSAELHKRCITGAVVASVEILDRVPAEVLADLETEFAGEEEDETPVEPRTLTVEDLDDAPKPAKPRL
jgi:hypothetical protein